MKLKRMALICVLGLGILPTAFGTAAGAYTPNPDSLDNQPHDPYGPHLHPKLKAQPTIEDQILRFKPVLLDTDTVRPLRGELTSQVKTLF